MCYSNCKNENHNGECKRTPKHDDTEVHCFEGFECSGCQGIFENDDNHEESNFCETCFIERELIRCARCENFREGIDIDKSTGYCPECIEIMCSKNS